MGNALNQTEIERSLAEKRSVLINLDSVLPIISITQGDCGIYTSTPLSLSLSLSLSLRSFKIMLSFLTLTEAHYGPGPGCPNSDITQGYPHGDQVSKLLDRFARDDDQDLLGMAVVRVDSQVGQGEWQYLRGNWTKEPEETGNNTESGQTHTLYENTNHFFLSLD